MTTIRTMLVDDEALARARLRRLLEQESDIEIVGECVSGREAIEQVGALRPALLFLDVQMPETDGFGVLRALAPEDTPFVVFVTAYDEHAVRAFEVRAIDYLLKPIDGDRVREAMARVRLRRGLATAAEQYAQLRAALRDMDEPRRAGAVRVERAAQRLLVRDQGVTRPVPVADIDWIDAVGNYARLHVGAQTHVLRATLTALETALEPAQFCRVHRSALVNLDRIAEVQPWASGDSVLILRDGTRLRVSRRYRAELERRLGAAF